MIPKTQIEIEHELGKWDTPISTEMYLLDLCLVESSNDFKLHLPNPDNEITIIARPGGFQLTSNYNNIRRDFAIEKSQIISVELLPSFTISNYSKLSLKYILFSIVIFLLIGLFTSDNSSLLLLWLFLGATFGMTLSINFKKIYRQNLLLVINGSYESKVKLLLSIDKKQEKRCVEFFSNFIKEKFTHN